MAHIRRLLILALALSFPLRAAGTTAPSIVEFTVRTYASGSPAEIDADPDGFFGYVQAGDDPLASFVDETFFEFDSAPWRSGIPLFATFAIESPSSNLAVARTFDASTYLGSGADDVARFGAGSLLATLSVPAPATAGQSFAGLFFIDITTAMETARLAGQPLGIRLHHPRDAVAGSDRVPFVQYLYGSARLTTELPEPPAAMLAVFAVIMTIRHVGRRSHLRRKNFQPLCP